MKSRKSPKNINIQTNSGFSRRDFLKTAAGAAVAPVFVGGCKKSAGAGYVGKRVLVLGIDGMDFHKLMTMMHHGQVPNFVRLSEMGGYSPLISSYPAQSPVAWSNFMTGLNPGGHGIYDFIHRDPSTMLPFLSTTKTTPPKDIFKIGKYRIPLDSARVDLLRKGETFWQTLEKQGIPSTIFRMPANFPPAKTEQRSFSGMGTPDIHGSYGSFTFFTEEPERFTEEITGGEIIPIKTEDDHFKGLLKGPANSMVEGSPQTEAEFDCYVSRESKSARIDIAGKKIVLTEKEWSDWVTLDFEMIPLLASASGIVRFYLKSVSPKLELYVSPINIDPADPAMPVSTPPEHSKELADEFGPFYTQGMPEDTKALTWDVFDHSEFAIQADYIDAEYKNIFWRQFDQFSGGVYFQYVSILDLSSHMFWHLSDPKHPAYDPALAATHGDHIDKLYMQQDKFLGEVLDRLRDDDILYVVSDHGFAPFRRTFNVNRWLIAEGYMNLLIKGKLDPGQSIFKFVNWTKTRAYSIGFNSIYLNMHGREANGIPMSAKDKDTLLDHIMRKLEMLTDGVTGEKLFRRVYRKEEIYSGDQLDNAPDLLLGYARGFRSSWETAIGEFGAEMIGDNTDRWGSDHCMDPREVPGILLSNRKLSDERDYFLYDMAPTILDEFGVAAPAGVVGKTIIEKG